MVHNTNHVTHLVHLSHVGSQLKNKKHRKSSVMEEWIKVSSSLKCHGASVIVRCLIARVVFVVFLMPANCHRNLGFQGSA